MSRLMSEAKNGFYPTNPESLKKVFEKVRLSETVHMLDPCCGEGDALASIASLTGNAITYGIELDIERAKIASTKLNVLLNADALNGVSRNTHWAGLVFLNPPYGRDSGGLRLEEKFVKHWGNIVINGGYLLLAINGSSATETMVADIRAMGYKPVFNAYDATNEEYQKYGQFFALFKRIDMAFRATTPEVQAVLDPQNAKPIEEIQVLEDFIPEGRKPRLFKEREMAFWKMDELLKKSTVRKDFQKNLLTVPMGFDSIEELNDGQRQFLLASGAIDEPIKEDENDLGLLLKGTVRKVSKVATETQVAPNGENIARYSFKESFITEVYGLDLNELRFYKYE